jgi:hypothetical protein
MTRLASFTGTDAMPKIRRVERVFWLLCFMTGVSGCSYFVSHYDAGAYQNFTRLKAYHLKFIDDVFMTDNGGRSREAVEAACDTGELKFREAAEYANGRQDITRVNAIDILHAQFESDCQNGLSDHLRFNPTLAGALRLEVSKNYDLAIAGELSRVDAPPRK